MSTAVIEFKLLEERYCFNTVDVAYVFELEEYNKVNSFHDAVIGITKYNRDVMLLIDTAKLYSGKSLNMTKEKSVIVIHDKDESRYYGMLVDEIIKLEEVEKANPSVNLSTKDMIINHYKDENENIIVNEIYPLPLLQKYNIPAMTSRHFNEDKEKEIQSRHTNHYLIVRIGKCLYALASKYVKEVLENEFEIFNIKNNIADIKGAIALRNEIVQVVDFEDPSRHDIVIVEYDGTKIAFEVDEVYDIEDFQTDKIEYLNDASINIEALYSHNEKVIAILNPLYYFNKKSKKDKNKEEIIQQKVSGDNREYLIFYFANKKYSIGMEHVRQVIESETLAKTHSSAIAANDYVEFIATWNHQAVSVIKLDSFLGVTTRADETQIVFIQSNKKIVAFLVDDIDNIVYLDKSAISEIKSQESDIVSGAIVYNDEIIVKLNEKFLTGLV